MNTITDTLNISPSEAEIAAMIREAEFVTETETETAKVIKAAEEIIADAINPNLDTEDASNPKEDTSNSTQIEPSNPVANTALVPIDKDKGTNTEEPINIHVVDISDQTKRRAHDMAREKLTANKNELKGVSGVFKKIWKYGYFEGTVYQKYKKQALEEERSKVTDGKTADRFEAGSIKTEKDIEKTVVAKENKSANDLRDLILKISSGEIASDEYLDKKRQLISELFEASSLKGGTHANFEKFEDNIDKYIDQIKLLIEHGKSVEEIRNLIVINLGIAKDLSVTRVEYSKTDRLLENAKNRKFAGKLVNETVVASAFSVIGRVAFSVISSKAATIGSFGAAAVASSLLAAGKEKQRIKRDRQMHMRDVSSGRLNTIEGKRREQIQKTAYELMPVKDTLAELSGLFDKFKDKDADSESFNRMVNIIGEYRARRLISADRSMDLFLFSSPESMQEEFTDLDWYVKYVQSKLISTDNTEYINEVLENKDGDLNMEELLNDKTGEAVRSIEEDMAQKDSIFKGIKTGRIGRQMAWNLITGLVVGSIAQGVAREFMENHEEAIRHGVIKQDFLEGLLTKWNQVKIKKTTYMHDASIRIKPKGNFAEIFVNGKQYQEVPLNKNGTLTKSAIQSLKNEGIHAKQTTAYVGSGGTSVHNAVRAGNTSVQRNQWFNNNNAPGIDTKNELGIQWGSNTGYNSNKDVVFNIADMTNKGSYQGASSIATKTLIEQGKMKVWVTASKATQNKAFVFNVQQNGQVIIPKNSAAYKLFSPTRIGGHAQFNGAFVEAIDPQSVTKLGTQVGSPVATYIGTNTATPVTIAKHTVISLFGRPKISSSFTPKTQIGWPWFIPIVGRTPLEKPKKVVNSNQSGQGSSLERFQATNNGLAIGATLGSFQTTNQNSSKRSNSYGADFKINNNSQNTLRNRDGESKKIFEDLYIKNPNESTIERARKRDQGRYSMQIIRDYIANMSDSETKKFNEFIRKSRRNKDLFEGERDTLFSDKYLFQDYKDFSTKFENDGTFRDEILRKWGYVYMYYLGLAH
jgi:hypothetical protein